MKNTLYNGRYWILSLSIPLVLIAARMVITHSLTYGFYYWNLLLALVPLLASACLDPRASLFTRRNICCLAAWFFFLPNAPYLITDMVHFQERPPFPVYVDEVIVYASAWNGVLLAYVSVMRVERWLLTRYAQRPVNIALIGVFLLTGLGIYLGRFLRWNTWDMLVHPYALSKDIGIRMLYPIRYKQTWAVSLLFGGLLMAGYTLLRNQIQGKNTIWGLRQRTRS
jgi:uncharacterized membrane protein